MLTPPLPEVLILRSGYASRDLWLAAIAEAERLGRRVVPIDSQEPEADDW